MFLDSQQVVQNHLREGLCDVYSKQASSTVCVEKYISQSHVQGLMGNFPGGVKGSLGTDEFLERRTIIKKDLEIGILVCSKELRRKYFLAVFVLYLPSL